MCAQRPAIAVLCSGDGTNLQAILDAVQERSLRARVVLVISDRPHTKALARAAQAGVSAQYFDPARYATRERYDQALLDACETHRVQLLCLAGFMRIISPVLIRRYPHRILNIHPALLPAFRGAHAIRDTLAWGVRVTGVTGHLVDARVDHGPILLQEAVTIQPDDTEERLQARLHKVEHRLYPQAIRLVLGGHVRVVGRKALISL